MAQPLKYVPDALARHGMREGHAFPLVSDGKTDGGFHKSFREPADIAWRRRSIELRSATAWTAMILDCDTERSLWTLHDGITSQDLPWPNCITERVSNGHCHAVWFFLHPVLRGARASERAQRYAANVNEYYRHRIESDPGYRGILTHNPLPVHDGAIVTRWGSDEPYELDRLAKIIPLGWKRPKLATTGIGRNCSLFEACMKWAGSPDNLGFDILPAAMAANEGMQDKQGPLPIGEVRSIAKSVERYRRKWIDRGQFDHRGDAQRSNWGKALNARSVAARQAKNFERNANIVADFLDGKSQNSIARQYGLTRPGIQKIITKRLHAGCLGRGKISPPLGYHLFSKVTPPTTKTENCQENVRSK